VLYRRGDARQQVRVLPLAGDSAGPSYDVDFPDVVHAFEAGRNPEFHAHMLRFTYSSPRTPPTVYDFDLGTRARVVRKVTEVPNFQAADYVTERLWAPAPDGARIPISLLYRKTLRRDVPHPMLLMGYGSYGYSYDPGFSSRVLPLVDRGYVFGIAHIRGGQEMGRPWYDQGKMLRKKTTFTDFIAVAEYLQRTGWTSADRLAIRGGSAGGLLMGAVTNMRPDLFRVVIADVPFVDLINTMRDPTLEFTTQEWQQWGNPNVPEQFAYMRSYSPYDNVERQAYPAMLVTAGLNDPRVNYWEPAKWVAKLRADKTDDRPLVFRINMDSPRLDHHLGPLEDGDVLERVRGHHDEVAHRADLDLAQLAPVEQPGGVDGRRAERLGRGQAGLRERRQLPRVLPVGQHTRVGAHDDRHPGGAQALKGGDHLGTARTRPQRREGRDHPHTGAPERNRRGGIHHRRVGQRRDPVRRRQQCAHLADRVREHHPLPPARHLHHRVERRRLELDGIGECHRVLGPAGDAHLDEVRARIEIRPGAHARLRGAVHRRPTELAHAVLGPDPGSRRDDAGAGNVTLRDRVAQANAGAVSGAQVHHRGKPGPERG
jgi:hypothetical protein